VSGVPKRKKFNSLILKEKRPKVVFAFFKYGQGVGIFALPVPSESAQYNRV
jgi:hypothetical protein